MNSVDVVGNKRGNFLFCSLTVISPGDYRNLLVGETVLDSGPVRPSQIRDLLMAMVPGPAHVKVMHKNTLYVVGPSSLAKSLSFRTAKKTKSFYALHRVAKAVLEDADLSLHDFCDLCRSASFFRRNLASPSDWNSWYKPALVLLNGFWSRFHETELELCDAKWLGNIARRTGQLPSDRWDAPECEVLLSCEREIGVAFNWDGRVTYVSPMFVSREAFSPGFRDSSGVCCNEWTMLYVDKARWLQAGLPYYVPHRTWVPRAIVRYFDEVRPADNDKHRYAFRDMQTLSRLLK